MQVNDKGEAWCESCSQKIPAEGHGAPCYYCGEPCDSLAGNAGKWPIALAHNDDLGIIKWHHAACVSRWLFENIWLDGDSIQSLHNDATKWRQWLARERKIRERWHMFWFIASAVGMTSVIMAAFMNPWVPVRLPMVIIGAASVIVGMIQCSRFAKMLTPEDQLAWPARQAPLHQRLDGR